MRSQSRRNGLRGGISGSGPADAAAVAMVMVPSRTAQGYPRAFSASLIAAAGSTAILIPPSIAFIIYSVRVPGVSVPAPASGVSLPGAPRAAGVPVPRSGRALRVARPELLPAALRHVL